MKGLLVVLIVFLLIIGAGINKLLAAENEQPWVNFYFSPDKYKFGTKGKLVIEYGNIPGGLAGSKITLLEEWQETTRRWGINKTKQSNELSSDDFSTFTTFTQENGKFEKNHEMSIKFDNFIREVYPAGCTIIYHLTVENDKIGTIKKSFKVFYR